MNVERELVTLNSKVRGSGTDTSTTTVAIPPFTVAYWRFGVHGRAAISPRVARCLDSTRHARQLELGLTNTKALSLVRSVHFGSVSTLVKSESVMNVGAMDHIAYVHCHDNQRIAYEVKWSAGREENGPVVSTSTESDNSWDFHGTSSRDIESIWVKPCWIRPGGQYFGQWSRNRIRKN